MTTLQVIKVGGNELDDLVFLEGLISLFQKLTLPTILVHGGGKEISQLQTAFGVESRYVDGLRVTDETTLTLTKMVLCGSVNTRLVERLNLAGVEAQGLSGLDRGLLRAEKINHPSGDLGRVGEVISVRGDLLEALLAQKVTPVVAPICLGQDGAYNVNADYVAGAIGANLNAERVVFLTNVAGVLQDGEVLPHVTAEQIQRLIETGVISGGMIPKVKTALEVVKRGAKQALITNLAGLGADSGTRVTL